jgi:hypothetical protein
MGPHVACMGTGQVSRRPGALATAPSAQLDVHSAFTALRGLFACLGLWGDLVLWTPWGAALTAYVYVLALGIVCIDVDGLGA